MCARCINRKNRIRAASSDAVRALSRLLKTQCIRALLSVAFTVSLLPGASATSQMTESDWIVAIARFVEWPNTDLRDLIVCSPPRARALTLGNRFVRGLRLVEKHVRNPEDTKSCHVLVLFSEQKPARWIQAIRGLPILTIGHGREFCVYGGIVCIVAASDDTLTRHRVNLEMLARAGLYARNELLTPQLAKEQRAGAGERPGAAK
jgi:YfiR/HmsC-like